VSTDIAFRRRRASLATRWRRRARAAVPVLVWLGAIAGVLLLVQGRRVDTPVTGLVDSAQHAVLAPLEGRLDALLVSLHQDVAAGQLLARLHDEDVRLRLLRERHELERLRAELRRQEVELDQQERSATARQQLDSSVELRRLTQSFEQAQLEALAVRAEVEESRVRAQGLSVETDRLLQLTEQGMLSDTELVRKRTELDALHKRIAELDQLLAERRAHADACRQRLQQFTIGHLPGAPRDAVLEPQRWLLREQETRIERLALEARQLDLLAPAAGRVGSLNCQPGAWLRAGVVMLTLVDPAPRRILGYVPEALAGSAVPAREVTVLRPATGAVLGSSPILSVSAAMVLVPTRLWRDPRQEEWAWEIVLRPTGHEAAGERVGLLFR
jgi:multidrug resistance efflux pump